MTFERQQLKNDRCLGRMDDLNVIEMRKSKHIFLVGSQTTMNFLWTLLSNMLEQEIWVSDEILQEYGLVVYYSK